MAFLSSIMTARLSFQKVTYLRYWATNASAHNHFDRSGQAADGALIVNYPNGYLVIEGQCINPSRAITSETWCLGSAAIALCDHRFRPVTVDDAQLFQAPLFCASLVTYARMVTTSKDLCNRQ